MLFGRKISSPARRCANGRSCLVHQSCRGSQAESIASTTTPPQLYYCQRASRLSQRLLECAGRAQSCTVSWQPKKIQSTLVFGLFSLHLSNIDMVFGVRWNQTYYRFHIFMFSTLILDGSRFPKSNLDQAGSSKLSAMIFLTNYRSTCRSVARHCLADQLWADFDLDQTYTNSSASVALREYLRSVAAGCSARAQHGVLLRPTIHV